MGRVFKADRNVNWRLHQTDRRPLAVTAFHNTRVRPLATSGPMVELGGRFVHWRTNRARRKLR